MNEQSKGEMNELPKQEEFYRHLNSKFNIYFGPAQPTEVELTEVGEKSRREKFEAFSLIFVAPKSVAPEQLLYRVEHPALGAFELFLVPVGETSEGYQFEALFNQEITATGD